MAEIFLSYDSKDLDRVLVLAKALQSVGYTVFYDRTIPPGKIWRQVLGKAIEDCGCMVVVWSKHSVESNWVVDEEAPIGRERKILVPVFIDQVKPPLGFKSIQGAHFLNWQGDSNASEFLALTGSIAEHIGLPDNPAPSNDAVISLVKTRLPFEPEMVTIPAGSFQMGSNNGDDYEKPIHTVTIAKPFALGKYPVTFAEYDYFAEQTGSPKPDDAGWGRDNRPVINVSWHDAQAYVAWLSQVTDKTYRLPSEAEWEYAIRAGSTSDYYWGDDIGKAKEYAWFDKNSVDGTKPVGQLQPNAFGLYDMAGNVWEWQQDIWHESYNCAPSDGSAWVDRKDAARVVRGGSWISDGRYLRSASRFRDAPDFRNYSRGFRLALGH